MRVVDYTTERTRSIPLTAIDGRSGAGKSSIVRHVMRAAHGRVTAVVRNLDRLRRPEHAGGLAEFFKFLDAAVPA